MFNKETYTPQEVADLCGVTVLTVYRWIKEGKMPAQKKEGQWKIAGGTLNRVLEPVPPAERKERRRKA